MSPRSPRARIAGRVSAARRSPRLPAPLRDRTLIAVLGMHRSGTSVVAGMLADHGIELGPVSERNRFNPRGNREIPELNRLHDRVLARSGGSWWRPPARLELRRADVRDRNRILATIQGRTAAVKDPRMLPCLELWRDLEPWPVGVIRNPVAVRGSLERRARERPRRHPQLSSAEWEELWLDYNRILRDEHRRRPFPVVDFDRPESLDEQVRGALGFWGLEPEGESGFFERELVAGGDEDWRERVVSRDSLALWDELAALAAG